MYISRVLLYVFDFKLYETFVPEFMSQNYGYSTKTDLKIWRHQIKLKEDKLEMPGFTRLSYILWRKIGAKIMYEPSCSKVQYRPIKYDDK